MIKFILILFISLILFFSLSKEERSTTVSKTPISTSSKISIEENGKVKEYWKIDTNDESIYLPTKYGALTNPLEGFVRVHFNWPDITPIGPNDGNDEPAENLVVVYLDTISKYSTPESLNGRIKEMERMYGKPIHNPELPHFLTYKKQGDTTHYLGLPSLSPEASAYPFSVWCSDRKCRGYAHYKNNSSLIIDIIQPKNNIGQIYADAFKFISSWFEPPNKYKHQGLK